MINFPFGTNGKLIILVVPTLKRITLYSMTSLQNVFSYWLSSCFVSLKVLAFVAK